VLTVSKGLDRGKASRPAAAAGAVTVGELEVGLQVATQTGELGDQITRSAPSTRAARSAGCASARPCQGLAELLEDQGHPAWMIVLPSMGVSPRLNVWAAGLT
jgi:hypothetical protein